MNTPKQIKLKIFSRLDDLYHKLAEELVTLSTDSTIKHIALSGGSTPKGFFQFVVSSKFAKEINWNNLHFWWGDERFVDYDDVQSNFGEAHRILFNHISIPPVNLHPVPVKFIDDHKSVESLASLYGQTIQNIIPGHNGVPSFDWIWLGVGEDGHTASLFPAHYDVNDQRLVLAQLKPVTNEQRISLSAKLISHATRVTYLVTGTSKANIMAEIINKTGNYASYPAFNIQSEIGLTEYWLDNGAGQFCLQHLGER